MTRTRKSTVLFRQPFVLSSFDEKLPAGAYDVETDEELLEGISFPAYRRTLTVIYLHPTRDRPDLVQSLTIDPNELEAALERDRLPADAEQKKSAGLSPNGNLVPSGRSVGTM